MYEASYETPSEDELYELMLTLDEEKNAVITRQDFNSIDERCFGGALKLLRAKKKRFSRFMNAIDASDGSGNGASTVQSPFPRMPSLLGLSTHSTDYYHATTGSRQVSHASSSRQVSTAASASVAADATTTTTTTREKESEEDWRARTISEASAYGKIHDHRLADHFRYWKESGEVMITHANTTANTTANAVNHSSRSHWRSKMAIILDSFYFDIFIDSIISLVGILSLGNVDCTQPYVAVAVLSVLEAILKLFVKGTYRYVKSSRNSVDGIFTIILIIIMICQVTIDDTNHFCRNFGINSLILIRVLLFPRNILATERFRNFRQTHRKAFVFAFQTANQFMFLLLLMFILFYFYAALGLQLFGGTIVKTGETGERITNSLFGQSGYWPLSFNDMPSSLVTMFILLHVNNMHVTASGYVAATSTQWAELFFAIYYALAVLLLLNILTAVIINQFVGYLELLAQQRQQQEAEDRRVAQQVARTEKASSNGSVNKQGLLEIKSNSKSYGSVDSTSSSAHTASALTTTTPGAATAADALVATSRLTFSSSIFASDRQREQLADKILATLPSPVMDSPAVAANNTPKGNNRKSFNVNIASSLKTKLLEQYNTSASSTSQQQVVELSSSPKRESLIIPSSPSHEHQDDEHDTSYSRHFEDMTFSDQLDPIIIGLTIDHTVEQQQNNTTQLLAPPPQSIRAQSKQSEDDFNSLDDRSDRSIHSQNQSWFDWLNTNDDLTPLQRAAVLVQFAREGEQHFFHQSQRALYCYRLRTRFSTVFKVAAACWALIRFFERPLWTYRHESNWHDSSIYPLSGVPILSIQAISSIKLPILTILIIGFILEIGYKEHLNIVSYFESLKTFFSFSSSSSVQNKDNKDSSIGASAIASASFSPGSYSRFFRVLLTCYAVSSWLIIFGEICSGFTEPRLVTATSIGTVLYVLWFNRRSFEKTRIILRIFPRFSLLLVVFVLFVLLFAGIGPFIFHLNKANNNNQSTVEDDYFRDFNNSIWSVFVAITASSYPNQIMPSYQEYREVAFYFITFVTLGSFGFLNLIVVIVLVEFQKAGQLSADTQRVERQILLMKAFHIICDKNTNTVDKKRIALLLDELYSNYGDFVRVGIPTNSAKTILIDILDVDGDGQISLSDFLFLLDVIRIKLAVEYNQTFVERYYPNIAKHWLMIKINQLVTSRLCDLSCDFILAILLILSFSLNVDDLYTPTRSSLGLSVLICILTSLEAMLKMLVYGPRVYFRSFRNKLDFILTVVLFASLVIDAIAFRTHQVNFWTLTGRIAMMARLLLLPRNLRLVFTGQRQMLRLNKLLRRVFSKILTLGIVFLCVGYAFATVGVIAFGGGIRYSNTNVDFQSSTFVENDFYTLSFNDFASACMTLFVCLKVSDFDVVAAGFSSTSGNIARFYFAAWYVIGVLLLLNVLKSFFLGEFLSIFFVSKKQQDSLMRGLVKDDSFVTSKKKRRGSAMERAADAMERAAEAIVAGDEEERDTFAIVDNPIALAARDILQKQFSSHSNNDSNAEDKEGEERKVTNNEHEDDYNLNIDSRDNDGTSRPQSRQISKVGSMDSAEDIPPGLKHYLASTGAVKVLYFFFHFVSGVI